MNGNESHLSIEDLRSLVRIDEMTWTLYWMRRGITYFDDGAQTAQASMNSWNAKYANKPAFTAIHRGRYFCGAIHNVNFFAHRVIFALHYGRWPDFEIDHVDGNGFNNNPANMRDVPHQENMKNQKRRATNTTGFTGVSFAKSVQKYEARVHVDGRAFILGYFESASLAGIAIKKAQSMNGYHTNHGRKAT